MDFNISTGDIVLPEYCPFLGLLLKTKAGPHADNSPSLDRIDNTKGYVKGNIIVISARANRLKGDATFDELIRIGEFYRKLMLRR